MRLRLMWPLGAMVVLSAHGESWEWLCKVPEVSEMAIAPSIARDGAVYFSTSSALYRVHPTDRKLLRQPSETSPYFISHIAVSNEGRLYLAGRNRLSAFTSDCAPLWTRDHSGGEVSTAIGENGVIYAGFDKLSAITADGTIIWKSEVSGMYSPVVQRNGNIVLMGADDQLYSVSPSGKTEWKCPLGRAASDSGPALDQTDQIYVPLEDPPRIALIANSGRKLWEYRSDRRLAASVVIGFDGRAYCGTFGGFVYCLNPDGSEAWCTSVGASHGVTSTTIGSSGRVYVTAGTQMVVIDSNGNVIRKTEAENTLGRDFLLTSDGFLLGGSLGGIVRIYVDDKPLEGSWSTARGNSRRTGRVEAP